MKVSITDAVILVCAMGGVIFFCRAFPFLFFSGARSSQSKGSKAFLDFVERIAPPVAMTVLAFNALGPSIKVLTESIIRAVSSLPLPQEFNSSLAVLVASVLTVILHLLKRNALMSIFGGTAMYMVLQKIEII
jgi:branched-subunit amino acid transport protein AzlD